MNKCIDSLLKHSSDVEIIIINDGSTDKTLDIANSYKEKYPECVKVIDKENGGHGSGVNAGLLAASGLFYKVVDSDDWVDDYAYTYILDTLKKHYKDNCLADLYISNYVYEHTLDNTTFVMEYNKQFPKNVHFGWRKVKRFHRSHIMMMHALMYNRLKLIESKTTLPEHTFYVDALYAFKPLPFMKTLYYMDVNFYRYFIGRPDQSINITNFVKRYTQQDKVFKMIFSSYSKSDLKKLPRGLRKYMFHYIAAMTMNTMLFILAEDSVERRNAINDLWMFLKVADKKLFTKLYYRSYPVLLNFLPWKVQSKLLLFSYKVLCDKIKLG
jgi:glycosyltransferase involved in cell wall biosynthesis